MSNVQLPDPEAGLCLVKPAATLVQFVHLPQVNDAVTKDAASSDLGWVATLSRSEGALVRLEPMVAP